MSFAQPWALLAAAAVAAVVVALHFLARRRPRAMPLPTARFVPARTVRAPARSTRPSDLLLLALRVLAVLLAGAAFARPVVYPELRPLARVVALDLSASARSPGAGGGLDSASHYLRDGDMLVVFDSAARLIGGDARDSLSLLASSGAPGSLAAALVSATRAASVLRGHADSVELVLISPFAGEEWDASTGAIRARWRGRARLVRTEMAVGAEHGGAVDVRADVDDPVRVAAALMDAGAEPANVRIERGELGDSDSAWTRGRGHVLVRWPASAPDDWPRRDRADTIGAVVSGDAVLVASFARDAVPPAGRVIARWVDGAAAATERAAGGGCVRYVAIPFPAIGDLALGESARRFVRALVAPCGGVRALTPLPDSLEALLSGGAEQAGALSLARPDEEGSTATIWLLIAAALLLLAEPLARAAPGVVDLEEGGES